LRCAGTLLVVVSAGLLLLAPLPAHWIERAYSSRLYPAWQQFVTALSNTFPFALFDLWLVTIAAAIVGVGLRATRGRRSIGRRLVAWVGAAVVLGAVVYVWFSVSWGLNYHRQPLSTRLPFDRTRITPHALERLAWRTVGELNRLHAQTVTEPWPALDELPSRLADPFARAVHALGLPAGTVAGHPKRTLLQPYFRYAAIDGMTDPFFLEVLINSDALPPERPFIVAHEWGHLAGLAHEAEASYFGWRLCTSGNHQAAYSGWLFLYSHAAAALPPHTWREVDGRLAAGPRRDLAAIAARAKRASPVLSGAAWRVYDRYLKSQRVREGVASYNAVIQLVLATSEQP
jgi:Protein of unknown function (DUF3810)